MNLKQKIYLISASVIVIFIIVFFDYKKDNRVSKTIQLKAKVEYSDRKFTVKNNDTLDFIHADISIDKYYKIRNINLQKGETYIIWQTEFLHHNGLHYSINGRPVKFSIYCDFQDGITGYYAKKIIR